VIAFVNCRIGGAIPLFFEKDDSRLGRGLLKAEPQGGNSLFGRFDHRSETAPAADLAILWEVPSPACASHSKPPAGARNGPLKFPREQLPASAIMAVTLTPTVAPAFRPSPSLAHYLRRERHTSGRFYIHPATTFPSGGLYLTTDARRQRVRQSGQPQRVKWPVG
jgi:hypothetical protein